MKRWSKKEVSSTRITSQKTRIKLGLARKNWLKTVNQKILNNIKQKISDTQRRRYASGVVVWNKGKKRPAFSKEWRENLSIAGKNRKVPQGVIDACILRNKTNNPMWDLKTIKKAVKNRDYRDIAYKTTQTKIKNGTFLEYSKRMKENNPMKNPEINKKVNQNPAVIKKRIKALILRPNKKEKILIDIIKKHNFPYNYVGDGEKIIGVKNPDFIMKNGKKIIELFGDYWHTKKVRCFEETEKGRIEYFKKYRYKTLVIWEHELNNPALIADKIKNF